MVADCIAIKENLEACTDEELVVLTLAGREQAFRHLFDRHASVFNRVALSIVRDETDAQDVVQIAFLNMVRKLDTFNGGGSVAGWGYRIVRNAALMHLRWKEAENGRTFQVFRAMVKRCHC